MLHKVDISTMKYYRTATPLRLQNIISCLIKQCTAYYHLCHYIINTQKFAGWPQLHVLIRVDQHIFFRIQTDRYQRPTRSVFIHAVTITTGVNIVNTEIKDQVHDIDRTNQVRPWMKFSVQVDHGLGTIPVNFDGFFLSYSSLKTQNRH